MSIDTKPRVLVIGGYGVFGGRLSRRLARHDDIEVLVAGRSMARAETHCAQYGGTPIVVDTSEDLARLFAKWHPIVVVDAAGPFQKYAGGGGEDPFRVARAAIDAGAHYLDLADDAAFVAEIGNLDAAAHQAGVVVLSGCSSVPAISAAAARALTRDLVRTESIRSAIMPGNRAPRGRSVMEAILAQVGRPIETWRAGEWRETPGWCDIEHGTPEIEGLKPLGRRPTSAIGAPDLTLFPEYFKARTVGFRAGLELRVMHYGLWAIAHVVRWGLLRSAQPLWRPLLWAANLLKPFGTDRGAMTVDVIGHNARGDARHRRWTLIAEAGDGPEIPPTPAYLLALRLCRKTQPVAAGARPCLDELTLAELETSLREFAITTEIVDRPITPLFALALERDFTTLPSPLRDLHDLLDERAFVGEASVERGTSWLAKLIGWCIGFPAASDRVPVRVDMRRCASGEIWQRRFGSSTFRSHLSRRWAAPKDEIWERFGPLWFRITLQVEAGQVRYPLSAAYLFGKIPLPAFLVPISDTREYVDAAGRACFDVSISMPIAGFIVRYRGWLKPLHNSNAGVPNESCQI